MTSENKKFVELVAPDSVFEAAGGRVGLFGYSTTQETLRMQYGASPTSQVAFMAKRNGSNTFTGLQTFGAGFVNTLWVGAGFRPLVADDAGVGHATDAATFRSGIAAAASSDLANYQPLDDNLTAIASLTTTTFGRSLLTQESASAARTTIGALTTVTEDATSRAGNSVYAGPSAGAGAAAFRALTIEDLPSLFLAGGTHSFQGSNAETYDALTSFVIPANRLTSHSRVNLRLKIYDDTFNTGTVSVQILVNSEVRHTISFAVTASGQLVELDAALYLRGSWGKLGVLKKTVGSTVTAEYTTSIIVSDIASENTIEIKASTANISNPYFEIYAEMP